MHKTISRVLLICSISLSALLAAPPPDQNLLFHAPLSNCLDAETSAGTVSPKRAKGDLPIEDSPMGPALLAGSAESQLMFFAKDNVSSKGGTVSFFISPRWLPDDGNLHQFFSLKADGRIDIYKHTSSNRIVALIGGPNKNPGSYMLSAPLDKIEPGDTFHVALRWEHGHATLFLNGTPVQTVEDAQLEPPTIAEQSVFFIGDYYAKDYATPPKSLSGNPDTFISDFKIYSQPSPDTEITQEAKSKTKLAMSHNSPTATIPFCKNPPKIDGAFSLDEWAVSSAFTGYLDLVKQNIADRQTTTFLCYDSKFLYVAMVSFLRGNEMPKSTTLNHDGQVWEDDSYEIFLDPTGQAKAGQGFQMVINHSGTVYDAKNGNPSWSSNIKTNSFIEGNWRGIGLRAWIVECAIPFETLGVSEDQLGASWRANFARTWFLEEQTFTSWSPSPKRSYSHPETLGIVKFGDESNRFQWITIQGLETSKAYLEGYWYSKLAAELKAPLLGNIKLEPGIDFPFRWTQEWDLFKLNGAPLELRLNKPGSDSDVLYSASIPVKKSEEKSRIKAVQIPSKDSLIVDVFPMQSSGTLHGGRSASLKILQEQREVVSGIKMNFHNDSYYRAEIDTKNLPDGRYTVEVELPAPDGKIPNKATTIFDKKPRPAWFDNKIGKLDYVPSVWHPVKAESDKEGNITVQVWGRKIIFGQSGFPTSIISQGSQLLAEPIEYIIETPSSNIPQDNNKHQKSVSGAVLQRDLHLTNRAVSFLTNTDQYTLKTTVEFDGMMWFELQPKSQKINALELMLKLPSNTSTLYHPSSGDWAVGANSPGATPKSWSSRFIQSLWLGDEKVGLSFFAESDQFWKPKQSPNVLCIKQDGNTTALNISFVGEPSSFNQQPVYRFGLHPTPTRPLPTNWRSWQFSSSGRYRPGANNPENATHSILWWMEYSPKISSPLEYYQDKTNITEQFRKNNVSVIPYQALTAIHEHAPYVDQFKDEWLVRPSIDGGGENGQRCLWVSLTGSFSDYFLYSIRELQRAFNWNGIYFDFCQGAKGDANEYHGSGYLDEDGVRRPTYDILAQRDFLLRLITMYENEFGIKDPIIMGHVSANKVPPVHSLVNIHFDGEQHKFVPKVDKDYTKVISLESFRAEFLNQFGSVPVLLPQLGHLQVAYQKAKTEEEKQSALKDWRSATDTMLIYPLLHGTWFVPFWLDMPHIKGLLDARREFDMADARFFPYWEKSPYIKIASGSPDLKVSIFSHQNRIWIVCANMSSEAHDLQLNLNFSEICPLLEKANARISTIHGSPAELDGSEIRSKVSAKGPSVWIIK